MLQFVKYLLLPQNPSSVSKPSRGRGTTTRCPILPIMPIMPTKPTKPTKPIKPIKPSDTSLLCEQLKNALLFFLTILKN